MTGPSAMPHMPWPPAMNTRGSVDCPISGSPSAVHGRAPTHSSSRWSRWAPASGPDAASRSTRMRRGSSGGFYVAEFHHSGDAKAIADGCACDALGGEVHRSDRQMVDLDGEAVSASGLDQPFDTKWSGEGG